MVYEGAGNVETPWEAASWPFTNSVTLNMGTASSSGTMVSKPSSLSSDHKPSCEKHIKNW